MSGRGLELTPALLLNAYAAGIFPMAESAENPEIFWVDPELRGVVPLDHFKPPRSLVKRMRRGGFEVTVDQAFAEVVAGCADRDKTWINAEIQALYLRLYQLGFGHSVEVWMDGHLAGGLYGVTLGGAYFGESMFSRQTDASKIAFVYLVARLKAGGFTLLDTQFVTEHLRRFGTREITRAAYHKNLRQALEVEADYSALTGSADLETVLQLCSQIS